jgi:hypothetical protein
LPARIRKPELLEVAGIADHRDRDLDSLVRLVDPSGQGREQKMQLLEIVRGPDQVLLVALAEHDDVRRLRHPPVAHLHFSLSVDVGHGAGDGDAHLAVLHWARDLRVRRDAQRRPHRHKPEPHRRPSPSARDREQGSVFSPD